VGGFGSDHEDRTELPAIARARAGGYPRAQTVIIGDTPRDIACARADGLRCIAVTTGQYEAGELAGADVVIAGARELLDVL
jgi:phosphoglycolate phosphatase